MSVQFNRVKRSEYPLLVIGLGGTGTDALLAIKETFRTQFELPKEKDIPERTAYLAFDTDLCDLAYRRNGESKLTAAETFTLNIPHGLNAMVIPSYVKEWFDTSKLQAGVNQPVTIDRQTARLALFWNADAVYDKLKTTIDQLIEETENGIKTLDVVFTTGISGGTGSGLFLDMAYLLQHLIKTEYPRVDCCLTAYIVLPDVNVSKFSCIDPAKKLMMEATGFAALKELDYWMNESAAHFDYDQMYSPAIKIKWRAKPFNNVILMDSKNEHGDLVSNSYWYCLEQIGMSLFLFYAAFNTRFTLRDLELQRKMLKHKYHNRFIHYPANHEYLAIGCVCEWANEKKMEGKWEYGNCNEETWLHQLRIEACTRLYRRQTGDWYWPSHLVGIPADDFEMREKVRKHLQHDFCEIIEMQTEAFFLLNVVNGIPLCEYADLARLEQSYDDILRNQNASQHLV